MFSVPIAASSTGGGPLDDHRHSPRPLLAHHHRKSSGLGPAPTPTTPIGSPSPLHPHLLSGNNSAPNLHNGPLPQLHPLFALVRNLANLSPHQQSSSSVASAPSSSSSASTPLNGFLPFCGPSVFGGPFLQANPLLAAARQHQQSPKQQQSSPIAADPHQQMMQNWLMSMLAVAMTGQTQQHGHGQDPSTATKKLESDAEGNAICPACKEPIGKEPAQWGAHLEAERSRLRADMESLRTNVLAMEGNGQNAESGEAEAEEGRRSGRELLEGIRENQRRRMSGKSRGQFHMASAILAALIGTFDVGEGGAASVQKTKVEQNGDEQDECDDKGRKKEAHVCSKCACPSEIVVLNFSSRGNVLCLNCFRYQQQWEDSKRAENTQNCPSGPLPNGCPAKRVSPFSVLDLAGTGAVEAEKRPRLEL